MSKFLKLCSCEFTKVFKKKSTKVMFILLILALLASAGLTALTKKVSDLAEEEMANIDYKADLQAEIDADKREISESSSTLDEGTKIEKQARIDINQFAIDNDININLPYWKAEVLYTEVYGRIQEMYKFKGLGQEDDAKKEEETIKKLQEFIKNDDFAGYINYKKADTKLALDKGEIDEQAYNSQVYILDLKEKYEIGKEYKKEDSWKLSVLYEIEAQKDSLVTGIDQTTYKALTEKTYKEVENRIKINEYRLEHNLPPYAAGDVSLSIGSSRKVYDYMAGSFIQFILTVMMVVIAGTAISSEISKGTIKFWSFNPYKRWKILLSKLLVSTCILVITTVIISLLSTVVGNIFFGSGNAQGYLYVSNGNVHEINYILFSVLYNLVGAIEIFVFMVFALMLSTVARNSAVAVGLSIATYLGGSTIMQIINLFVKKDWIKFIPFNNLSLQSRIFNGDVSYSTSSMISGLTGNIPLDFSFAVLGVCVFLMVVTMFDSFRKRDIV